MEGKAAAIRYSPAEEDAVVNLTGREAHCCCLAKWPLRCNYLLTRLQVPLKAQRFILIIAELPILHTDLKVFLPLSLSWQLEFEDQPPWVASRDRRAMHAHVSSYRSAPYSLAINVLHAHALRSFN